MGVKTVFCTESVIYIYIYIYIYRYIYIYIYIYIYKSIHILDMYVFNFRPHLMQVVLVLQGKH